MNEFSRGFPVQIYLLVIEFAACSTGNRMKHKYHSVSSYRTFCASIRLENLLEPSSNIQNKRIYKSNRQTRIAPEVNQTLHEVGGRGEYPKRFKAISSDFYKRIL